MGAGRRQDGAGSRPLGLVHEPLTIVPFIVFQSTAFCHSPGERDFSSRFEHRVFALFLAVFLWARRGPWSNLG